MRTVLISNTYLGLAEAYEAADGIIVGMALAASEVDETSYAQWIREHR